MLPRAAGVAADFSAAGAGAQLFFSLFVLVAFFSQGSAFGYPFLVLGLWKFGFPETVMPRPFDGLATVMRWSYDHRMIFAWPSVMVM